MLAPGTAAGAAAPKLKPTDEAGAVGASGASGASGAFAALPKMLLGCGVGDLDSGARDVLPNMLPKGAGFGASVSGLAGCAPKIDTAAVLGVSVSDAADCAPKSGLATGF